MMRRLFLVLGIVVAIGAFPGRAMAVGNEQPTGSMTAPPSEGFVVVKTSDLVVQTSDNEGTPVSLIEAQAAGVPVLSTRVGGARSAVADSGFLPSPEDEDALAQRTRSLLDDRDLAARIGPGGQSYVLARFNFERLASDIDAIYRMSRRP